MKPFPFAIWPLQKSIPEYTTPESAADSYRYFYRPYIQKLHATLRGSNRPRSNPDNWQGSPPYGQQDTRDSNLTDSFMARMHHVVRGLIKEGILSPIQLASPEAMANPQKTSSEHYRDGEYTLQDWSQLHGTPVGYSGIAARDDRLLVHVNHKLADGTSIRIPFYFSTGQGDKDTADAWHEPVPSLGFYPHAGFGLGWIHKNVVHKDRENTDQKTPWAGMTNSYHNPVISYYKGILDATIGAELKKYAMETKSRAPIVEKFDPNHPDNSRRIQNAVSAALKRVAPSVAGYDTVRGEDMYAQDRRVRILDRLNGPIVDWLKNHISSSDIPVIRYYGQNHTTPKGTYGSRWAELVEKMKTKEVPSPHTAGRYFGWLSGALNSNPSQNAHIEQNGVRMPVTPDAPPIGSEENPITNPSKGLSAPHPMVAHAVKTYGIGHQFGSALMDRLTPKAAWTDTSSPQPTVKSFFSFAIWPLKKAQLDFSNSFNTQLSPAQEQLFSRMAEKFPQLQGSHDYDMRGWWLSQLNSGAKGKAFDVIQSALPKNGGHYTDQFKKPNHPTFSTGSQYHGVAGHVGGQWSQAEDGSWDFHPSRTNLEMHGPAGLQEYWDRVEPTNRIHIPSSIPSSPPLSTLRGTMPGAKK